MRIEPVRPPAWVGAGLPACTIAWSIETDCSSPGMRACMSLRQQMAGVPRYASLVAPIAINQFGRPFTTAVRSCSKQASDRISSLEDHSAARLSKLVFGNGEGSTFEAGPPTKIRRSCIRLWKRFSGTEFASFIVRLIKAAVVKGAAR